MSHAAGTSPSGARRHPRPGHMRSRSATLLLSLPLLLLLPQTAHTATCAYTNAEPTKPRYLKFCQDYQSNACCLPGHDLENQLQFDLLTAALGPGCKNPMMYPAIRYFYCLGCDPMQPNFTAPKPLDASVQVVRVCSSFIEDALWHPATLEQYHRCGVMKPNPCPASFGDHGMDPYACGDDIVIPDQEWPTPTQFMNFLSPPGLYGPAYEYEIVNSTFPDCWVPPVMRSGAASLSRVVSVVATVFGMLVCRYAL